MNEKTPRLLPINLLNYLAVFIVFSDALTYPCFLGIGDFRFSYIIIALLFLAWALKKAIALKNCINVTFIVIMLVIIVSSIYNMVIGKDNLNSLLKPTVGILLNVVVFYLLFEINDRDVFKQFQIYLNLAFMVAFIGLIQELNYVLDWESGYNFHYILPNWKANRVVNLPILRLNSIINEPTDFCYAMMPAFFAAIAPYLKDGYRFMSTWRTVVIVVAFLLSFSLVGYLGIIFVMILLILNYRKKLFLVIGCIAILLFGIFVYAISTEVKLKVDESIALVTGHQINFHRLNYSTYGLFTNAKVAWRSLIENPVFGSGLGSHEISYDRFIDSIISDKFLNLRINAKDASSLLLRLLSETGLFGLVAFIIFIRKFYISKQNDMTRYSWIINNGILCVFLMRLLRQGHYFSGGFFFFLWMYYFSSVNLRKNNYYKPEVTNENRD